MVVTITGSNDFARKNELDTLLASFVAEYGDIAVERYDGDESAAARMRESISSMPFLSSRKLVILREPGKHKVLAESIAEVLEQVAETTDLILYEPKLDKRGSYYKSLKKLTDFREFPEVDAPGLAKWAVDFIKQKGGTLSSQDAKLLVDRVGTSQQLIRSELEKLFAYDPRVTGETIKLLTEPSPQSTIFELIDAAFSGRTAAALALYKEQRALRVEPQAILAMLVWQVHVLLLVKAGEPRVIDDIARAAKLSPYVARKTQSLTRARTLLRFKQLAADLLRLDLSLKTSAIDADEAVQLFILKLG